LQNDIHSPCITVHESLLFSARLRFTKDVSREIVNAFVEEVMLHGTQTLNLTDPICINPQPSCNQLVFVRCLPAAALPSDSCSRMHD
jgi:hypothetical protein